MLTLIAQGVDSIEDNYPIGPEGLFSNDPIEIAISCFLNTGCPSFRHLSSLPIDLRAKKAPSPPTDVKRKGNKGLQQINNRGWIFSIRRIVFSEAVIDFRTLLQEKEARSIGSSVSKGLRYFVLSGGNFKKVFYILKDCLKASLDKVTVSSETTNVDNGGSKRIALQTIVKPGPSKKSKAFF